MPTEAWASVNSPNKALTKQPSQNPSFFALAPRNTFDIVHTLGSNFHGVDSQVAVIKHLEWIWQKTPLKSTPLLYPGGIGGDHWRSVVVSLVEQ
jgi:hypothetical protein